MHDLFIGRDSPLQAIRDFLGKSDARRRIRILPVSGPGGIGKTFLLAHALEGPDYDTRGYLNVRLRGMDDPGTLGTIVTEHWIAGTSTVGVDVRSKRVYRQTKRCGDALVKLDELLRDELLNNAGDDPVLRSGIQETFKLIRGASFVLRDSKAAPAKARALAQVITKVPPEVVERVADLAGNAEAYVRSEKFALSRNWRAGLRNRFRAHGAPQTLAECLVEDIEDILHRQKLGLERLLLIIDDYEGLQPHIEEFLIDHLLKRMDAEFEADIIVLGRDALADTHPAWKQHYKSWLEPDVKLLPFSEAETRAYCAQAGLSDATAVDRIVAETQGFPFLVASEVDDELSGGRTALGLKTFFDRTTRWMSPAQREWFRALVFLDEVNLDTIPRVLPEADPAMVLSWFENESSIRDNASKAYTVRPIIRSRIREYVAVRAPSEAAARANQAANPSP